jgi:hypothetical protein
LQGAIGSRSSDKVEAGKVGRHRDVGNIELF